MRQPVTVKELALSLKPEVFEQVTWRQGSNAPRTERFAAVRVRHAGSKASRRTRLQPEQWWLIEWPHSQLHHQPADEIVAKIDRAYEGVAEINMEFITQ